MHRSTVIVGAIAGSLLVAAASFMIVKVGNVVTAAEEALRERTGYALAYSGLPGISLFPQLAVTLGNVTIASADGGGEPLATASEMRLKLDGGLFQPGQIAIAAITLTDGRINMNIGRDGKANWLSAGPSQHNADSGPGLPIRIANGTLQFRDERSGFAFAMDEIESDAVLAGADGELTAKGGLVWNRQPVNFTLFLKSPRRLAEDGSPLDLNFSSPALELAFSGRAATAKGFDISGQATAKSADARLLALWFGKKLAGEIGFANLDISGNLDVSEKAAAFRNAQLSMDGIRGQGDIIFARNNGNPHIAANLGLDRIDLNVYRSADARARPLTLLEDRWPTDTLNLAALNDLNASLTLAANQIIFGDLKTGPTRATAELKNGVLDLKLDDLSLYGGKASAQIRLDGASAPPSLAIAFTGQDVDAEDALRGALAFGKISGRLATSFSVATAGSSLAEFVSRLRGSGSFRITQGSVRDMDLTTMVRLATETVTAGWPLDPALATPFDALSASYTIEDGIAATQNLVLAGPRITVAARGEIDLARQAFDLAIEPRLAPGNAPADSATEFVTLPVAIIIKGPWIGPRIYPDMPGVLDDPAAAFSALKKLGLGTAASEPAVAPPAN